MTRFVVDCGVVLHLASDGIDIRAEHELLAPTLLRSQTLAALHETVYRGEIAREAALDRLARIRAMPIVSSATPCSGAGPGTSLGWAETYDAEYLALIQLSTDAFVTLDNELARRVEGVAPRRRSRRCEPPDDAEVAVLCGAPARRASAARYSPTGHPSVRPMSFAASASPSCTPAPSNRARASVSSMASSGAWSERAVQIRLPTTESPPAGDARPPAAATR